MSARHHDGVDAPRALRLNHQEAGGRIAPRVSEETPRHRKLAAGHGDGAMVEVDAQREIHRIVEHAERFHVIRQRDIAKACPLLRSGDRLVDEDRTVAGQKLQKAQNLAERFLRLVA